MNIKWMTMVAVLAVIAGLIVYASTNPATVPSTNQNAAARFEDPVEDPNNLLPHATVDPVLKVDDDPRNDRIGRKPASAE